MKRFLVLFTIALFMSPVFAEDEIVLEQTPLFESGATVEDNLAPTEEQEVVEDMDKTHSKFLDSLADGAHNLYKLQIDNIDEPSCLLKEQLTHNFEKGPLESAHLWGVLQTNMSSNIPEHGSVNNKFNVGLINVILDGKFRGGKENFRIMLDPTPQHKHTFFQPFVQDLYVETHRIPHHTILLGNSRPGVGYEGAQSPYTLPLVSRSQISRNFANIRKFGIRVRGNYALVDYDFGGKLVTGGGIVSGKKHSTDYFVASAYVGYQYKKLWMRAEYANADGSNGGDGLTNKKRQGWYVTLGYRITKKLEAILRYDEFDPDKRISNNNKREYTAGINYYIKGQALKLILNYVYCQNNSAPDSHRIIIGSQIAL